ncbi:MAG: altronate dehydratase family protein [Muribaculaceae bacterium]|nr:altronate dehydratase family protein [Muribaculaceae bacterium]
MKRFIRIDPKDNVAVSLVDNLKAGEWIELDDKRIKLLADIPRGHKFALAPIEPGKDIVKYGYPIGHALSHIAAGERVHTHNLATSLGDNLQYEYNPVIAKTNTSVENDSSAEAYASTMSKSPVIEGYLRHNGDMGIRNELWILPTVGCVNGSAQAIARRLLRELPDQSNVDDIIAFTHNYGCSQLGADHANTRKALAALARHPNAGGVIVLGLGCENNRIDQLREEIGDYDPDRVKFITAQEVTDEIEEGVRIGRELLAVMRRDKRQPLPFSKLKVGLKCGGSDGLSGITANPLVGLLTDRIVGWGATAVLTEVPEMFGAETILMDRAISREVFNKTVDLINNFKDYFRQSGQPVYENPSPGNKEGGITTLEEKSLGCIQKGGKAPVVGVLEYAQSLYAPGLNLLNAPGNDLVASTALALSGCQLVLFTTGRGTPFGTCVPTLKISTNTQLAQHKPGWIDFNAGTLIVDESPSTALDRLTDEIVAVADGKKVKQEINGYREISIFKTGVTL